ncbi:alpha/beta hydrolase [Tistrella mobilis]|uniref:Alpha/beta hydrolase n=1 Tax=Tistrella mobilis TaxID=171437 RepID=A0A162JUG1_9PROT|nr:alpha/beta hydrolase [Tistrella mobilis]KYO49903.1 alpha/beta hydrolase [Tistrella mobilis]
MDGIEGRFVANGPVRLHVIEAGRGEPVIFVHEFAGDRRSWEPQMRRFARSHRVIAYDARGYPPSDVPEEPDAYGQEMAVDDIRAVMDGLGIDRAHLVGCSMGGFAVLHFGLTHPARALSITAIGAGYGAEPELRESFAANCEATADRILADGLEAAGRSYMNSPGRRPFATKDPRGADEAFRVFLDHSPLGAALTLRRYQARRPSLFALEDRFRTMTVPVLLIVGDTDTPAIRANLFLKETLPSAGLTVLPMTGHAANLEEPELVNRLLADFFAATEHGRWPVRDAEQAADDGDVLGMGGGR